MFQQGFWARLHRENRPELVVCLRGTTLVSSLRENYCSQPGLIVGLVADTSGYGWADQACCGKTRELAGLAQTPPWPLRNLAIAR